VSEYGPAWLDLAPDEDDDGECYCPNCGVLLTLNAEDLDLFAPETGPTML
jgi:hypothetical protein